jgi:rubrerythrin
MAIKAEKVLMHKLTCEVCGHQWQAQEVPLRCAKCKTPYWNKKKKLATA